LSSLRDLLVHYSVIHHHLPRFLFLHHVLSIITCFLSTPKKGLLLNLWYGRLLYCTRTDLSCQRVSYREKRIKHKTYSSKAPYNVEQTWEPLSLVSHISQNSVQFPESFKVSLIKCNIPVISLQSVLLVAETGVLGENHRPLATDRLYHIMLYSSHSQHQWCHIIRRKTYFSQLPNTLIF
jgi:hypothetical protein